MDCSCLITWIAAIAATVTFFFGAFNIYQYTDNRKITKFLKEKAHSNSGFIQIIQSEINEKNKDIELAIKSLIIAIAEFSKCDHKEYKSTIEYCYKQIDRLNGEKLKNN